MRLLDLRALQEAVQRSIAFPLPFGSRFETAGVSRRAVDRFCFFLKCGEYAALPGAKPYPVVPNNFPTDWFVHLADSGDRRWCLIQVAVRSVDTRERDFELHLRVQKCGECAAMPGANPYPVAPNIFPTDDHFVLCNSWIPEI